MDTSLTNLLAAADRGDAPAAKAAFAALYDELHRLARRELARRGPHLTLGIPEEMKGPDVSVWVAVLLIQAVPYGAAVLVALLSALSLPAKWLGTLPTQVPAPLAQPEP